MTKWFKWFTLFYIIFHLHTCQNSWSCDTHSSHLLLMPHKMLCICVAYYTLLSQGKVLLWDLSIDATVHTRRALQSYYAGIDKRSNAFSAEFALWMTFLSPPNYLPSVTTFVSLCRVSCSCEKLPDPYYLSQIPPKVEIILTCAFSSEIITMLEVRPLVRWNGKYLMFI